MTEREAGEILTLHSGSWVLLQTNPDGKTLTGTATFLQTHTYDYTHTLFICDSTAMTLEHSLPTRTCAVCM